MKVLCVFAILLNTLSVHSSNLVMTDDSSCSSNQIFETTSLSCTTCGNVEQVPHLKSAGKNECACAQQKKQSVNTVQGTSIISCVACPAYTVPATSNSSTPITIPQEASVLDQTICLPCFGKTGRQNYTIPANFSGVWEPATFDKTSNLCQCSQPGFALTDISIDGTMRVDHGKGCIRCPENTYVDANFDRYSCLPCPDPKMSRDSSGNCVCASGMVVVEGNTCVLAQDWTSVKSKYSIDSYAKVTMYNVENTNGATDASFTVDQSQIFVKIFPAAASNCATKARLISQSIAGQAAETQIDSAACQALANLCTLSMYDPASAACALLASSLSRISLSLYGQTDWKASFPWISYSPSLIPQVVETTDIQREFQLKGLASYINMTLSVFLPNGTWLGYEPVVDQLQLCPGAASMSSKFRRFGSEVSISCDLDVSLLVKERETRFYDLYINDFGVSVNDSSSTKKEETLYPVPVFISNIYEAGAFPNNIVETGPLDSSRRMSRRFFLVDAISGRRQATASSPPTLTIFRWAKKITFRFKTSAAGRNRITPPLMFITYGQKVIGDSDQTALLANPLSLAQKISVPSSFYASYTMDLKGYWSTVTILSVVCGILSLFFWIVQCFSLNRKLQNSPMTTSSYATVFAMLLGTAADFFFWFLVLMCGYWWIWFKGQSDIYVLLPIEDPHPAFVGILAAVTAAKILEVFISLYQDTSCDIFFIDWEKPRESAIRVPNKDGIPSVSVWRSIFVTNEWNELSEARLINLEFTLFAILFFMRGLDLQYLSTPQPNNGDTSAGETNAVLDFAVALFFWIIISLAQIAYKLLIHHRFVEDPCGQFVDILSLANISCFIMDSTYHGYYLHGRSVHQFADQTMLDMARQMQMEEEGQVFKRGLSPNSEFQVFEMFLTKEIREKYDSIFMSSVVAAEAQHGAGIQPSQKLRQIGSSNNLPASQLPQLVLSKEKLNQLLQKFISEVQSSPTMIRDKSILFQYLGVPPEMAGSTTSLFFADTRNVFSRIMPIGQEHRLLTFDILMFSMWNLITKDIFLATLLTYVFDRLLSWLRASRNQSNLARKTLVDDRFLI